MKIPEILNILKVKLCGRERSLSKEIEAASA
jgi:hypothetical protein